MHGLQGHDVRAVALDRVGLSDDAFMQWKVRALVVVYLVSVIKVTWRFVFVETLQSE
jgi:hypothetical protein